MIPKNINEKHVLKAIVAIKENGVLKKRNATKYVLRHDGQRYPPKYVISLANKFANGTELLPSQFNGGREVNEFLGKLGFHIEGVSSRSSRSPKDSRIKNIVKRHDGRCRDCKNTLIEMFRKLYGEVKMSHDMKVSARMEDHSGKPYYTQLNNIFSALEKHRGQRCFVKRQRLHPCDLYIPSINTVVEFDESQHFSLARKVALSHYPANLPIGFELAEWKRLCDEINAKDRDPKYRDEQRAWYDTIRDFLPLISELNPTVRIHMGPFAWCSLDPKSHDDVIKFRDMIKPLLSTGKKPHLKLDVVRVATVVVESDRNNYNNHSRLALMSEVIRKAAGAADVFIFPAGYYTKKGRPSTRFEAFVEQTREMITAVKHKIIVCYGIDGRATKDQVKDQIAVAVGSNGVIASARKFHPTKDEDGFIDVASEPFIGEGRYPRIFEIGGKRVFLAVCYDSYGIRQRSLDNPDIDMVFNLVHKFNQKDEGSSSEVYFAKHGFAGASKAWGCPTFGAAVFFNRTVPPRWPTGVLWNQGEKGTQSWRYTDNPLKPLQEFEIENGTEKALVRIYHQ